MNDLAVVELQGSEAELLAKIKPTYKAIFNSYGVAYSYDEEDCKYQIAGAEKVRDGIKALFEVGRDFKKNVAKFSLALYKVYDNICCCEDFSPEAYTFEEDGKTFVTQFYRDNGFAYIIQCLGISKSTAYRYKDLAQFVDEENGEFKDEYKNYSISLLTEIVSLLGSSRFRLEEVSSHIPCNCTVDDIREYKKIAVLWFDWKPPFKDFDSRKEFFGGNDFYDLTVFEVLEKYRAWEQKQAVKDLEDKLSGNNDKLTDLAAVGASTAKAVIVQSKSSGEVTEENYQSVIEDKQRQLLESDAEVTRLKGEIYLLKQKVVDNLDECEGCRHNGVKPQKCQCCRRNGKLKDLYEKAE